MDELYLFITASLLVGFGHCIGMCGPIVMAYSINLGKSRLIPHILYNLGRITTYGFIGGIAGLIGSMVIVTESIEGYQNYVMLFVGILMVVMGLSLSGWLPAFKYLEKINFISSAVHKGIKFLSSTKSSGLYYPMGIILGFLPCGAVYTAILFALNKGAGVNSPVEGFLIGMMVLLIFGISTMPAMLLTGKITSLIGGWLRSKLYTVSGILVMLMGGLIIYRSFS